MKKTDSKIVLIKRKSRLQDLIVKYNTVEQAEFYIKHMGSDFSDYLQEDKIYREALAAAEEILSGLGRLQTVDREFLPNFSFGARDTVVAIGQDGLVANTLKYLDGQPLIGVNPDPSRWSGDLLPFAVGDLPSVVTDTLYGRRQTKAVTMAQASLSDGQTLYAVNDLFIGRKTHVSARYRLTYAELAENQSSSGIIVSTGLGATGWLKSVLRGAGGVVTAITHGENPAKIKRPPWNADYLLFTVREPYPSGATGADIVFGQINATHPFSVVSQMPESGVIFSDGIENDFLEFGSGVQATVSLADKAGRLVV